MLLAFGLVGDHRLGWAAHFTDGRLASGTLRLLKRPERLPGERRLRLRRWLRAFHIGSGGLGGVWIEADPALPSSVCKSEFSTSVACWCAGQNVPLHLVPGSALRRRPRPLIAMIPLGAPERIARALLSLAIADRSGGSRLILNSPTEPGS